MEHKFSKVEMNFSISAWKIIHHLMLRNSQVSLEWICPSSFSFYYKTFSSLFIFPHVKLGGATPFQSYFPPEGAQMWWVRHLRGRVVYVFLLFHHYFFPQFLLTRPFFPVFTPLCVKIKVNSYVMTVIYTSRLRYLVGLPKVLKFLRTHETLGRQTRWKSTSPIPLEVGGRGMGFPLVHCYFVRNKVLCILSWKPLE